VKRPRRRSTQPEKRVDQTHYLSGKRRGALLKEEVWYAGDEVVKYSLAYINPRICGVDNGRVLGFDNSHNRHHRHYIGTVEEVEFVSYEAILEHFEREVRALWRQEDEEER